MPDWPHWPRLEIAIWQQLFCQIGCLAAPIWLGRFRGQSDFSCCFSGLGRICRRLSGSLMDSVFKCHPPMPDWLDFQIGRLSWFPDWPDWLDFQIGQIGHETRLASKTRLARLVQFPDWIFRLIKTEARLVLKPDWVAIGTVFPDWG